MPGITQYGFLLDSGVHFAALLRKVVGEVDKVSASVSQRLPYMPPADSVTALLSSPAVQREPIASRSLRHRRSETKG